MPCVAVKLYLRERTIDDAPERYLEILQSGILRTTL